MPAIKISETEVLDVMLIRSFVMSEQETPETTKSVLTITTTDGEDITLRGELADAAHAILRLHGF